jgi:hypothetical protein
VTDRWLTFETGEPLMRLPRPRPRSRLAWRIGLGLTVLAMAVTGTLWWMQSGPFVPASAPAGFDITPVVQPAEGPVAVADTTTTTTMPSTTTTTTTIPAPLVAPPEEVASPRAIPAIPVTSGTLADVADRDVPLPVRLRIPDLGVDAPIDPAGVVGDEMEIPNTASRVAWYEYGPSPGQQGSAVLAAHVDWAGSAGVFYDLRSIQPGALVQVEMDDGSVAEFITVELTSYGKSELPLDRVFARAGSPVVTLITCGGEFNPSIRRYQDNVVAYAVPVPPADGTTR